MVKAEHAETAEFAKKKQKSFTTLLGQGRSPSKPLLRQAQTVEAFGVEADGSLTSIGSAGGLRFGAQGVAAR